MLERQQMTPEEKRRRASEKTILIVEDNELNMKLFHDLIQAHGYNILQTKVPPGFNLPRHRHNIDQLVFVMEGSAIRGIESSGSVKVGRRQPEIRTGSEPAITV